MADEKTFNNYCVAEAVHVYVPRGSQLVRIESHDDDELEND